MPNHASLRSRPKIEAIKPSKRDATFYSHNGDALQGLRLAVGAKAKTWVISKRINGKLRSIKIGRWPELANGDAAMEVARDKVAAVEAGTDAITTNVATLMYAFEAHTACSSAKQSTKNNYRLQIKNRLADLFERPIERITLPMLKDAVRGKTPSTAQHLVQIIRMASVIRRCFDVSADLRAKERHRPASHVLFDPKERWPAIDLIMETRSLIQRTAWLTMLFTGFRSLNARTLTWDQVDLERKTITISEMKNGLTRTFSIADVVVDALSALSFLDDVGLLRDEVGTAYAEFAPRHFVPVNSTDFRNRVALGLHRDKNILPDETTLKSVAILAEALASETRSEKVCCGLVSWAASDTCSLPTTIAR